MKVNYRHIIALFVLLLGLGTTLSAQNEKKAIRQGNRAFSSEEYNESEIDYRRALEANPASFKASFNLGDALYKQEKYDEAARTFEEIKASNVDNAQKANVFYNLGNSLFKQEKYKESVEA
ncbi:MAG TPA: tetratricopeptide repeat protein, partial [Tenuifilaceae bacterium]|nr:tetratricopeptide repeat protein [Tenuifilaceae bacterium]